VIVGLKRPKGARYRNLYLYGDGRIWYERRFGTRRVDGKRVEGRRLRENTGTTDWDEAAAFRDELERRLRVDEPAFAGAPLLSEFAARYLDQDTKHLAATTRDARRRSLDPERSSLLRRFGARRLDEVTPADLHGWWAAEIDARGLSVRTGRHALDALAAVYAFARDLGLVEPARDPLPEFRSQLRRRARTKRGRAESAPGRAIRPIEDPAAIERLVAEAEREGPAAHALVVLLLDAGLRLGEALGLRWGAIAWGADETDRGRHLLICESRPRGGDPEPTKSGRERRVALSRRLRGALLRLYRAKFAPSPDGFVVGEVDPANLRHREWRRILKRAGIGHRALKDLGDTYASQLLTAGVNLAYVSKQLGHADVQVTARHYARWAGGDDYREPMRLLPGEVPADLLARLAVPTKSPKVKTPEVRDRENPRAFGNLLEHETGFEPATLTLAT